MPAESAPRTLTLLLLLLLLLPVASTVTTAGKRWEKEVRGPLARHRVRSAEGGKESVACRVSPSVRVVLG